MMAKRKFSGEKAKSIRIVNGDVDRNDVAYNPWRSALRKQCAELLDLSIPKLGHQPDRFERVRTTMRKSWGYLGGQLSESNFCTHVLSVQKRKRKDLKDKWVRSGSHSNASRPRHVAADQWRGLISYWTSNKSDGRRKSAARHQNKHGKDHHPKRGTGVGRSLTLAAAKQPSPQSAAPTANVKGVKPTVKTQKGLVIGSGTPLAATKRPLQEDARPDPSPRRTIPIHLCNEGGTQKTCKWHSDENGNLGSSEALEQEAHKPKVQGAAMALEPKVETFVESTGPALEQNGQTLPECRVQELTQSRAAVMGCRLQTSLESAVGQLPESTAARVERELPRLVERMVESAVQQLLLRDVESRVQELLDSRVEELLESRVQEVVKIKVQALLEGNRVQELVESRVESSSVQELVDSRVERLVATSVQNSSVRQLMQRNASELEPTERDDVGKKLQCAPLPLADDDVSMPDVAEHNLLHATAYYPSKADKDTVPFGWTDLQCLEPTAWISNTITDFYMKYIQCHDRMQQEILSKFHFFGSFFFTQLHGIRDGTEQIFNEAVGKWVRGRASILEKAYLLVPIVAGNHWSLAVCCHPGGSNHENGSQRCLLHLDSLPGIHDSKSIFCTLRRFLKAAWQHLKRAPVKFDVDDVAEFRVPVPRQTNAYDCGPFVLHSMHKFVKEAPPVFTKTQLRSYPESHLWENWYTPEQLQELRTSVKESMSKLLKSHAKRGVTGYGSRI